MEVPGTCLSHRKGPNTTYKQLKFDESVRRKVLKYSKGVAKSPGSTETQDDSIESGAKHPASAVSISPARIGLDPRGTSQCEKKLNRRPPRARHHRYLQSLLQENHAVLRGSEPSLGSCEEFTRLHCSRGGDCIVHPPAPMTQATIARWHSETKVTAGVCPALGVSSHSVHPALRLCHYSTVFT